MTASPTARTLLAIAQSNEVGVKALEACGISWTVPAGAERVMHTHFAELSAEGEGGARAAEIERLRAFIGSTTIVAHGAELHRRLLPELSGALWVCTIELASRLLACRSRYINNPNPRNVSCGNGSGRLPHGAKSATAWGLS
ncbi:MAG: 3'-5' exonuclease family protein [Bacillati bacterium]